MIVTEPAACTPPGWYGVRSEPGHASIHCREIKADQCFGNREVRDLMQLHLSVLGTDMEYGEAVAWRLSDLAMAGSKPNPVLPKGLCIPHASVPSPRRSCI
jgi:hypothetical protein